MENEEKTLQETPEVSDEAVEKAISEYTKEVEENRYETKKALMLTAIGAIIVIGAIAAVLALQKSPKETLSSCMHRTFTEESVSSRVNFLKDTFLGGKAHTSAALSLQSVSASPSDEADGSYAMFMNAMVNDLRITKPTFKLDLKTDYETKNILLNLSVDIADKVPDTSFPYDEVLSGEENKTCFDLSIFQKDGKAGFMDDDGKAAASQQFAYTMSSLAGTLDADKWDAEESLNPNPAPMLNVLDAALENADIHNAFSGASYSVDGIAYSANKYVVEVPADKKGAFVSAVTKAADENGVGDFGKAFADWFENYDSSKTEISVYERNGYIGAIEAATEDYSFKIMFVNEDKPCSKIRVSFENGSSSFSAFDFLTDGSYNLCLEDISANMDQFAYTVTGNIELSKTADDFLADVDVDLSDESEYDANLVMLDKIQKLSSAVMPTAQDIYTQMMLGLY